MYEHYEIARNKKGLKNADVCRLADISSGTMSDWKSGRIKSLKSDKLQRIADVLNVSIEFLLTGQEPEHESTTGKKYYFSDETAEAAQELFDDPDLHALFSMAKDSGPENVRFVTEMLRRLKDTNPEG